MGFGIPCAATHLIGIHWLHAIFFTRTTDNRIKTGVGAALVFAAPPPKGIAVVIDNIFRHQFAMRLVDMLVEHGGWFDNVIIHADDDHVFHMPDHASSPIKRLISQKYIDCRQGC
jgi:hypothetical protein